jgi:hypothetical protein
LLIADWLVSAAFSHAAWFSVSPLKPLNPASCKTQPQICTAYEAAERKVKDEAEASPTVEGGFISGFCPCDGYALTVADVGEPAVKRYEFHALHRLKSLSRMDTMPGDFPCFDDPLHLAPFSKQGQESVLHGGALWQCKPWCVRLRLEGGFAGKASKRALGARRGIGLCRAGFERDFLLSVFGVRFALGCCMPSCGLAMLQFAQ